MITKYLEDFDIHQIAASGQCFRLRPLSEDTYSLIASGRYLEIRQEEVLDEDGARVSFSCTEEEFEEIWEDYFDLSTDYGRMKRAIDPKDFYLQEAARTGAGIRILRQELWETIITFIISQQNNIPRIQKCVDAICREFGETAEEPGVGTYKIFPTAGALAAVPEEEFRRLGLGYRAPYLSKSSRMLLTGEVDMESLPDLSYEDARAQLLRLPGVGKKVADCICLFALHHIEAFPIDTHIKDMLARYKEGFPFERYDGFAGVIQQYAFYYELHGGK